MIVTPSGVVFSGQCEIQSAACTASEQGAITAVWTHSPREQINVCRACIEAMIRAGDWEVRGAKVRQGVDVVLQTPEGQVLLLVEVKRIPKVTYDEDKWAERVHRNLVVHGALQAAAPFLLAAMPKRLYFWATPLAGDPSARFGDVVELEDDVQREFAQIIEQHQGGNALEHAVAHWLSASFWTKNAPWLKDQRLQLYTERSASLRWIFQESEWSAP